MMLEHQNTDIKSSDPLNQTWFVIPAYNEASAIARVVNNIKRFSTNICVIDDGSSDATATVAAEAGAHVLTHIINRGQGAALQTGLDYALLQDAEFIVTFDADDQHDPSDVPKMIKLIRSENLDIVLGSRFLGRTENMPLIRKILLKVAVIFTNYSTALNLTDTHNGLRVLTRHAAKQIRLRQDRMAHASEILSIIASKRMRYKEYPVTIRYSDYSKAKGQNLGSILRILEDLVWRRISK